MDTPHYDVVIIGGGLVGISLALALSQMRPQPRVALVEAHDYQRLPPPGFDSRTVALSYSSRQIFTGLKLWNDIAAAGVAPIHTIHISDRGHPGVTRLSALEQGVDALGYVVENRVLGQVLWHALQANTHSGVSIYTPAQVTGLVFLPDQVRIALQHHDTSVLSASLVVAADGTQSFVRQVLKVKHWQREYQQQAIIANLAVDTPHRAIAYERFHTTGPMALLPLPAYGDNPHRYSLVWTLPQSQVETVLAWDDAKFLHHLQDQFGTRAGRFEYLGKRQAYSLTMIQLREHVRPRLAFIGNAAHTLHPVAGQGFNLGLRDVAALAQVIRDAYTRQADIGAYAELQQYARWRRRDQWQTLVFTDTLVRAFSTDFLPMVVARNAGLMALQLCTPLRKRVAQQAMGYIGRASLLARGLGL
ncbi:MAG: 2-octaprenyl-6-methoxyphenyl hydroxylase [Gammaproteobacteria bacterium]|nr:2-octaprenyl-6-methoxyphenyl hydroxylase [Gammaproteobacteria bacterium]